LKEKKRKKAEAEEARFHCSDELMEWSRNHTIWAELEKRTTEELKWICEDNGVLRGGPKYEIKARLIEHARLGVRKAEDAVLRQHAEQGSKMREYELSMRKFKSFEAALNHAEKLIDTSFSGGNKKTTVMSFEQKLEMYEGLSRGFDTQLYHAITGSRAGHYNGKYGETGIFANESMAERWYDLLEHELGSSLSTSQFQAYVNAIKGLGSESEPYGFETFHQLNDGGIRQLLLGDEEKMAIWTGSF